MIRLYYAPRTRSVRIAWLLEELDLPYELERVEFAPTSKTFFQQRTPLGKLPVIEDGDVVMGESGAIVEYILERYGDGRLAPAPNAPDRAAFLQWMHFAESTAYPPIGILVWLLIYRDDAADHPALVEDARDRAAKGLEFVEREIGTRSFLLGETFSAADIMMGFTLAAAKVLGVLDARFPRLEAYWGRLQERPALRKVQAIE